MSADNWAECPKCKKTANVEYKNVPDIEKQTMREDYDIGTKDGIFSITYSCYCRSCKFKYRYEYSKEIDLG